jgi:O-antigen biosynthesis protein
VVVSPAEQQRLRRFGVPACWVVPTVHPRYSGARPSYSEREGLLFIGGYGHPPNVDAALWLCREIMPRVWESLPDVTVTLLGYNPPPEIRSLESSRVRVPGYVQNVDDYFLRSRVFVAPVRFGAGINGKIGQSLSFGLPVVTTPVGAEGIGLEDGISGLVARDATEFAAAVVRAYTQQCVWERLSEGAWSHLKRFQPEAIGTDANRYLRLLE